MTQLHSIFYRFILDSLPSGVCAIDREGKIVYWNEGAERITGHLRQDVLGHRCDAEFLEHTDSDNNLLMGDAIPVSEAVREGCSKNARASLRGKDGHFVSIKLQTLPFRDERGSIRGAVEIFEQAATPAINNRRLNKLAAYGCLDVLTGVLTRQMMEGHLHENLGLNARHPVPFCIICVAVDDLVHIRERFGRPAVDAALRTAAQAIHGGLRPTDFVGRWSDLGLLAILTACDESEVTKVGERLRKLVHCSGINWWGDSVRITISIGATPAHDNDSVESIVARAQQALRESSSPPGNCMVVIHDA